MDEALAELIRGKTPEQSKQIIIAKLEAIRPTLSISEIEDLMCSLIDKLKTAEPVEFDAALLDEVHTLGQSYKSINDRVVKVRLAQAAKIT